MNGIFSTALIIIPVTVHILKQSLCVFLLLCIQDDPDAHKNFLRVNRAYEVLKDEDLRVCISVALHTG